MQSSSRQFSTANEEYMEYVLERLAICIRSVSTIKDRVEEEVGGDGSHVLFRIYQLLRDIVSRLQVLHSKKTTKINALHSKIHQRLNSKIFTRINSSM